MRIALWTALAVFALDQATKLLVVHGLDLAQRQTIDVWRPFLTFRMAWNEGINFGLLSGSGMRWILVAVALLISTFVLWWVHRNRPRPLVQASAGLLVGGALGNVVDRIAYGAVADFLNVTCCGIANPYAFNVADVGVLAGALGLVLFTGDGDKSRKRRRKKTP